MAVLTVHADRTYDWRCDGCRGVWRRYGPHRGPRRRFCKTCQNVRAYAGKVPLDRRRRFTLGSARYARATGQEFGIRTEQRSADA